MCYFSAEGHSREAREDEVLVVRRQPHGSIWLVSPDDSATAVCLRTGTEVELLFIPEKTRRRFGLEQEAEGAFKMRDWWRRDIFVLKSRRRVRLKKLQEGQVVRILSLPTEAASLNGGGAPGVKAALICKPEEAELADSRQKPMTR